MVLSDGSQIPSVEGTVQGCPIAMQVFAVGTLPMIQLVSSCWYADDAGAAGEVASVAKWFRELVDIGVPHGYLVNEKKTVALVKRRALETFRKEFASFPQLQVFVVEEGGEVADGMTEELLRVSREKEEDGDGRSYLGAAIGGPKFRESFVKKKVRGWVRELECLSEVAKVNPQVAYALLTKGVFAKWRYVMRTTETDPEWFRPLEDSTHGSPGLQTAPSPPPSLGPPLSAFWSGCAQPCCDGPRRILGITEGD